MRVLTLDYGLPDKTAQPIRRVQGTPARVCPGHLSFRAYDIFGKVHEFRFDTTANLLKHDAFGGENFGIKHHESLQRFLAELLESLGGE